MCFNKWFEGRHRVWRQYFFRQVSEKLRGPDGKSRVTFRLKPWLQGCTWGYKEANSLSCSQHFCCVAWWSHPDVLGFQSYEWMNEWMNTNMFQVTWDMRSQIRQTLFNPGLNLSPQLQVKHSRCMKNKHKDTKHSIQSARVTSTSPWLKDLQDQTAALWLLFKGNIYSCCWLRGIS